MSYTDRNMNDIVITYRNKENSEAKLRQILRKIENEFTGFNEVAIIGDIPDWAQGVIKIPHSYSSELKWKTRNHLLKLQCACLNTDVSVNFLWIDQDDMIEYNIDASKALRSTTTVSPMGYDQITFRHTQKVLERRGFRFDNYFAPYPISFSKINLMKTFDLIDFETPYGYCVKTLYCNFNRLKPANQLKALDNQEYHTLSSYEKF